MFSTTLSLLLFSPCGKSSNKLDHENCMQILKTVMHDSIAILIVFKHQGSTANFHLHICHSQRRQKMTFFVWLSGGNDRQYYQETSFYGFGVWYVVPYLSAWTITLEDSSKDIHSDEFYILWFLPYNIARIFGNRNRGSQCRIITCSCVLWLGQSGTGIQVFYMPLPSGMMLHW